MKLKKIAIVIAVDEQNGIGKNGVLAWNIKEDMDFFRNITTNTKKEHRKNAVIMGRKTWESIPERFRPLPGRINCILSSAYGKAPTEISENTFGFGDFEDCHIFLSKRVDVESIFIIGGSYLYNLVLDYMYLDTIYITKVTGSFDCDTFFSPIPERFSVVESGEKKTQGDIQFQMYTYKAPIRSLDFLRNITTFDILKYKKVFFYVGVFVFSTLLITVSFSLSKKRNLVISQSPVEELISEDNKEIITPDIPTPQNPISVIEEDTISSNSGNLSETKTEIGEVKPPQEKNPTYERASLQDKNMIFYYPKVSDLFLQGKISLYIQEKTLEFKILSFNEKNAGNKTKWKVDYQENGDFIVFAEYKNEIKIGENKIPIK